MPPYDATFSHYLLISFYWHEFEPRGKCDFLFQLFLFFISTLDENESNKYGKL